MGGCGAVVFCRVAYHAFEERVAAVSKPYFYESWFADSRVGRALLHYGRQLLYVADENEFFYDSQQSDDAWLKNLRSLVDDGQRESLQMHNFLMSHER